MLFISSDTFHFKLFCLVILFTTVSTFPFLVTKCQLGHCWMYSILDFRSLCRSFCRKKKKIYSVSRSVDPNKSVFGMATVMVWLVLTAWYLLRLDMGWNSWQFTQQPQRYLQNTLCCESIALFWWFLDDLHVPTSSQIFGAMTMVQYPNHQRRVLEKQACRDVVLFEISVCTMMDGRG